MGRIDDRLGLTGRRPPPGRGEAPPGPSPREAGPLAGILGEGGRPEGPSAEGGTEAAGAAQREQERTDFKALLARIGTRIHELEPRPARPEPPIPPSAPEPGPHLAAAPSPLRRKRPRRQECVKCGDRGYVVRGFGDVARAQLCDCRPGCETCGGEGHSIVLRDGYEYLEACPECSGLRQRISLFNQAHVPALHADKSLEAFSVHSESLGRAHQLLVGYVRAFPSNRQGVLLVGPPGVGKTHLMCGVIRHLALEKGVRCLFKDFFLLLSELKEAWDTGGYQSEIMRPLGEVDVLVVDELGKGRNSEWELNLLDEIVCKRYNRHKTTLFTTNYPVREVGGRPLPTVGRRGAPNLTQGAAGLPLLPERVSERVWSRLQEMCTIIELEAPDYRPRNGGTWS